MTEPTTPPASSTDELLARIAHAAEETARNVATLRTIAVVGVSILGGIVALYALVFLVTWAP